MYTEQQIGRIRKELSRLIKEKQKNCITPEEKNKAPNEARAEINKKYGKGWREKYYSESKLSDPSIYDEHPFGEHWMD